MARGTSRSKKKGNIISLDFTDVETRGRFTEEGDYRLKVKAATQEVGDKGDYINWEITCVEGDAEGAIVYNNTSMTPQSLWNLKMFLEALGVEIPDDAFDLDLDEVIDLEFMGTVELETYEGKKRPRLADFWAAEEEEKPKGKRGAGKKKDDEEEEEKPARGRRSSKKDDDDEKPARGRRGKKEEPEVTEEAIGDMDEDELEDLIKEHKLGVDLGDFSSLRKMRAAVIEAARDEGVLGDGEEEAEPEEKPARRTRSRR